MTDTAEKPLDFIRKIVADDLANEKHDTIVTRFPPEPNGYLHIGHAKSICLNFGIATEHVGARCHLRFDDTNPSKEEDEYVESIQEDVRWLGFDWGEHLHFASDYFDQLYDWAVHLIKAGLAYVDDQTADEIRANRGSLTQPGTPSPYRDRTPDENLSLFKKMKKGEFADGEKVLRAKIDMASPNLNLRDPALYRIMHREHHRTGDKWCIYPMYDWAHGQSDAIEGITHSLCTLEFENHRPLYEWFHANLPVPSTPRQIEFSRLNITYTVMSKRKLLQLVDEGKVSDWSDPRMPTISGLRRRGYTPTAIRDFCRTIGVTKVDGTVDMALLENAIREDLNEKAPRVMAVLDPLKVVIENWPEDEVDELDAQNHPGKPEWGTRKIPFGREIYVERDDFREDPPRKYHRLYPGNEVRLRYAYYITVTDVVKDAEGNVTELRATYDPESRGGGTPDERKVRGTIHWVSAQHSIDAEVRLYDHLFGIENPADVPDGADWLDNLNPSSLENVHAKIEPSLLEATLDDRYQFERKGYYCLDSVDTQPGRLVFNRTVALRDSWAKIEKKQQKS